MARADEGGGESMKNRKLMLVASVSVIFQSVWSVSSLTAQTTQESSVRSEQFWAMDVGSCARWLSDPFRQSAGQSYIAGFWTAMNAVNPNKTMRFTGNHTDSSGIFAEIEKICRAKPSEDLYVAAWTVYIRFQYLVRPPQ
jgi:hypothetical protein